MKNQLEAYHKLHDIISDLVEGPLWVSSLPSSHYDAIVEALEKCNAANHAAEVAPATPSPAPAGHTPGPWDCRWNGGGRLYEYTISQPGSFDICCVCTRDDDSNAANAALIASAPELLAALEDMVAAADAGDMDSVANATISARAAIQKARGGKA